MISDAPYTWFDRHGVRLDVERDPGWLRVSFSCPWGKVELVCQLWAAGEAMLRRWLALAGHELVDPEELTRDEWLALDAAARAGRT